MAPPYQGRERTWRFKLDDTTVLEVSTETPATKRVRPRGRFRILGALVVALTLLTVVFTAGAAAEGTPSIASDKADYLPGEAVALAGSGWVAGESVHVTVDDDQSDPWTHEANLTAADDGTFAGALTLPEVAGTYTVMATAPSGTAAATFTATAPAPPPPPPPPPPPGNPAIASDKADYLPGEAVALSGSGWVAGESVHVTVDDDQSDPWTHEADLTAADDGTLSDSFDLTELAGAFAVSATAPSGSADASFTVTAQPPAPTTDPTLSSDKDAYSPGETVTLTGADWTAGGTVHVAVDDDKNDAWEHSADVTVAANGTITETVDLPDGLAAKFTATATDPADRSATATFSAGFGSATEPYLVRFASGTSTETQGQILAAAGAVDTNYIAPLRIHGVLLPSGAGLQTSLDKLRSYPSVTRVEPDRTREAGGTPNDSNYGDQWSLTKIGWENVFGTVSPSGSAKVAILDTGIDGSHPDLDGNVVSGTSILDGSNGLSDPNGHGTAMAGIIAAETDNGAGVAGIGYAGVTVMPVTVLGADGTGQDSEIIEGVVYAAEHNADVILMAFSNPGYSEMLQAAIDYAWESGAVVVAATGNDGSSSVTFPAGDRGVIGVSNTDQSDALNSSSNYGQAVFLGAPGTGIATTSPAGGYTSITGTSASAAEVAGAAALISAASGASNGVIVSRLAKNAEAVGSRDQTGNGRLNLDRAVADTSTDSVQPTGADPVGSGGPYVGPYVIAGHSVSPASLSFTATAGGSNPASQTFTFSGPATCNGGTATDNQTWLSVSPTSYADFTSASSVIFTVSVNITGLSANTYNGTVTVDDTSTSSACADPRTVSVTLVVNPGNDAPVAVDDSYNATEDTPLSVNAANGVLANDSDAEGNSLTAVLDGDVSNGTLTLNADGSFDYTPNANFCGDDSFTYKANDGEEDSNVATVTIDVECVNDAPVAVDDDYAATEDTLLSVNAANGVLANDTDVDNDTLTAVLVTDVADGTLVLAADGSFTYDPDANFCGEDSFTYKANDGQADSNVATVTIDVECVNDAPVANDDSYNATEDTPLSVNAANGVLANDSDAEGDSLTAVLDGDVSNGTLTLNADGSFDYTPNANFCGDDSFTYKANDGEEDSNVATATIDVECVNDDPVANDDTATVVEDSGANTIDVLGNDTDVDGDTLSVSAVTQPANGTVVNNGTDVSYEPNPNYCNDPPGTTPDTFTYTASDGNGGTDTATVSVTVTCVNDDPVANDDTATVVEDSGANTIDVLGNDTDVDGDTLSVSAVTQPANGTVVNNGTDVSYEPNPNYCNDPPGTTPDTFTYTASDGNGGTDTATVSVTVTCVNDDPVANDDTATVVEDSGANTIDVLGNDTDVDGDTLSVSAVTQPANGTVVNNGTDVSYEPNPNYCNDPPGTTPDTFTYTASDGNGGTDTATVSVTVTCVNDAPDVDAGPNVSGAEGSPIALDGTVSDVEGDSFTVVWTSTPSAGVDAGATCTFADPNAIDTTITCTDDGTYTATLTATDSHGAPGSDSTTVTVSNANPEVTMTSPNEDTPPVSVGTAVNVNATFTDAGVNDTHTAPAGGQCVIDWDDGTTTIGTVTEAPQSGSGSCTGSHAYASLGVYSITVTVTDDDGGSGSDTAQIVVFDPNAGFVTGGGWIMVQPGSYTLNLAAFGKGNFGFVSKYKPGASTPSGETEFNFNTAAFKFHSETYKVLLVSGFKAQYVGTGRVNGESGYDFRLTAYDGQINGGGGVDKFRIKIRKNGVTIFDNRIANPSDDMETADPQTIGGGSIVIHKGK